MKQKHHKHTAVLLSYVLLSFTLFSGCSDSKPDSPANATEFTSVPEETSTVIDEETTFLPEGTAYIMEDDTPIYIDDLMAPVNIYNTICTTGNPEGFSSVFPGCIINTIPEAAQCDDIAEYTSYLYELYRQAYNDEVSMSNDFVSCQLLNQSELESFSKFYSENFGEEIMPEYAFIVESTYEIIYNDEEGNEQSDSDTDFFIAYLYNGCMYLDYFYIDTMDL